MLTTFNWADWVIVGIIFISIVISLFRGFVKEALSLLSWCAALIIALLFYEQLAWMLRNVIDVSSLRHIIAFLILLIGVLVIGALCIRIFSYVVDVAGLTGLDRVLGVGFGLVRGAIIVLVLIIILPPALKANQDQWWQDSILIPQFRMMEDWSKNLAKETLEYGKEKLKNT